MRNILDNVELTLDSNNLVKKSLHSGIHALVGQLLSFFIMMGSTAILARLLEPEDYGLIAIAFAITTFFSLFKDFGLSVSLIQKKVIKNEEVENIFWFTILIGLVLTIILVFLAFFVSNFFDDNRLIFIIIAMSSIFFIGSFSIVPNAILRRNMQFKKIMYIQIFSSFSTAIFAILLAYKGIGYWALVVNVILPVIMSSLITVFLLNWFPKFTFSLSHVLPYLHVGKYIMYFDIVNYFSRNFDTILIGKMYTTSDLGYYSKAYQLLLLPIQQIRIPIVNVALPALSSVRNDYKIFNYYYISLSSILNALIIPIVCLMWLDAYEIIFLILGEKWLYSAELFRLLAWAALIQPIFGTFGLVLITLNKNKKYLYWGMINFLIIISSFIIGINFSLTTFIIIYVIANYISLIISIPFVFSNTPINIKEFIITLIVPMSYFLPVTYVISIFFIQKDSLCISDLLMKSIIFIFMTIAFYFILPSYRNRLLNMKKIFITKVNYDG